ncbi:hypothetical protein AeRB84_002312 [Aphanomyces euteiches]|nr:hypothetical protein AeRB84_002312 [Aphanomyces euteiches]
MSGPSASAPHPTTVGNAFVKQYYSLLTESPETLHRFYKDESTFSHGSGSQPEESVSGQASINSTILKKRYSGAVVQLDHGSIDCQASQAGGVVVLVTGVITLQNSAPTHFVQTFFLAVQEKGFFVLNDVLRFLNIPTKPASPVKKAVPAQSPSKATQTQATATPTTPVVQSPKPKSIPSPPLPPTKAPLLTPVETKEAVLSPKRAPPASPKKPATPSAVVVEDNKRPESPKKEEKVVSPKGKQNVKNAKPSAPVAADEEPAAPVDTTPKSWASLVAGSKKAVAVATVAKAAASAAPVESPRKKAATTSWDDEPAPETPATTASPPAAPAATQKTRQTYFSLYVRDVPLETTSNELKEVFKSHGKIANSNVIEGKGYAFIDFYEEESVKSVLEALEGGKTFAVHDKTLHVSQRFQKEHKGNFGGRGGGRGSYNANGGGRGRGVSETPPRTPHNPEKTKAAEAVAMPDAATLRLLLPIKLDETAGKYAEAVDLLSQLSSWEERGSEKKDDKKAKDAGKDKGGPMKTRVQHNLALSQLLAGKSKFADFENVVMHLLSEMQVSVSQMQQSQGDSGSNAMLGLGMKLRKDKDWDDEQDGFDSVKGNSVFSGMNLSFQTLAMERDASLLRYNLALVYFRQKKYAAAVSTLDVLLRAIEPMDENVAMHICFLYLDVILHCSRSSSISESAPLRHKAQAIITYLESPHGFNGVIAPSTEDQKSKSAFEANVVEFKFRLHLYKAKLALLHDNLKNAKKEVKTAMEIFQKEIKSKEKPGDTINAVAVPIGVGSIFHPPLSVQNSSALFLKANMEYLRRNFKKCIKLVASCKRQSVDEPIFLNNLGCIHNQMGHHQAAQSYFAKALEATSPRPKPGSKATEPSSSPLSTSTQAEILYNNGLQLLVLKKYALAFRCLHAASKMFFNRPKLWLRLGECCTASYAAQRESIPSEYKNSLVSSVVGHGAHRRVVLPVRSPTDEITVDTTTTSDAVPTMNLPFAVKCFRNALLLSQQMLEAKSSEPVSALSDQSAGEGANGDAPRSLSLVESLDLLRQKALVNLVYSYLSMNAPELAISTAKELLALGTCTAANRFLVRSYYAEALCMLSRSSEASVYLKPNEMVTLADEYAREAKIDASTAQAHLHVNIATAAIFQKNTSVADQSVAQAVRLAPTSRHTLELLVYVLLRKGNTKKAMQVLKEARVVN